MIESPKWDESHKRRSKLLAEEPMGRGAATANEACPGGNVISVFKEQNTLQKSDEAWSEVAVGGDPILPPVLSNKSFIIFSCGGFFSILMLGVGGGGRVIMRFERMLSF